MLHAPRGSRQDSRAAFSLIELIGVILVIGVLASIAIGGIGAARQRANVTRARGELSALASALESYKRLYGDYPEIGPPDFNQANPLAPTSTTVGPGLNSAQAKLFNALTGVFGPKAFTTTDRINGPNFLDVGRFAVNGTLATGTFLIPAV